MKNEIEELKEKIKRMKEDGEIFGLVSEDYNKINQWKIKIKELEEKG